MPFFSPSLRKSESITEGHLFKKIEADEFTWKSKRYKKKH